MQRVEKKQIKEACIYIQIKTEREKERDEISERKVN